MFDKVQSRGFHAVYRENETNYCPGCGRTHWYIGRLTAECGFCSTAIPLNSAPTYGIPSVVRDGRTAEQRRPFMLDHPRLVLKRAAA